MTAPAQTPVSLRTLLDEMIERDASDLHISAGDRPKLRVDGDIVNSSIEHVLTPRDTLQLAYSVLTENQKKRFEMEDELDFSFGIANLSRFRGNVFKQRGCVSMVIRCIPFHIKTFNDLNLPPVIAGFADRPRGLVLVTGPTGSGKSTTLAAMIDRINETKPLHILTIEDPIEYLHFHKTAMINQREVGTDVNNFLDGLRSALREDPDVILLGEMRDLDSISITLTLAETGHLVFATLHTNDASQALDRIVDVFPAERRDQIQIQLAGTLQGVISQRLLPAEGGGRVAAYEVLMANDAVRNLVREGKSRQLRNAMISGQQEGMQTIEMDLARLVSSGIISFDTAAEASQYPKEILAQAATMRAQMQAQATVAAGQSASTGAGEFVGA